jgi:hypothetical protein
MVCNGQRERTPSPARPGGSRFRGRNGLSVPPGPHAAPEMDPPHRLNLAADPAPTSPKALASTRAHAERAEDFVNTLKCIFMRFHEGPSATLLAWFAGQVRSRHRNRNWQNTRYLPALGRLDRDLVHEKAGGLGGLTSRSDHEGDWDVELAHPRLDLEHLEFVRLGNERPCALVQRLKPLESGLAAPDRRSPCDPENLGESSSVPLTAFKSCAF